MASNRPPKKPPPPDPQRLGKPALKGKGRAKTLMPEVDDQADQTWQGVTFSEDKAPVFEGKKKQKQWLENEAEEAMAWETPAVHKDIWGTTQQAEPIQEEVNRFLSYRNDPRMDLDIEIATLSIETSEASQPTSLGVVVITGQFIHEFEYGDYGRFAVLTAQQRVSHVLNRVSSDILRFVCPFQRDPEQLEGPC
jgi:hypothetical protein